MFSWVLVTRDGWGDVWGFGSRTEALEHPLCNTDPVVGSVDDVVVAWGQLHIARVHGEVLGDQARYQDALDRMQSARDDTDRRLRHRAIAEDVLLGLRRVAKAPPSDPQEIVRMVTEDRRAHARWREQEEKRRTSIMTQQQQGSAPKADKKEKAPKAEKTAATTFGGQPLAAKIHFGKNDKGEHYGPENNPKRAGSKAHGIFALYKNGMTVEQARDAGVTASDLKWDVDHGFITVG